jgi:hypothetical protein
MYQILNYFAIGNLIKIHVRILMEIKFLTYVKKGALFAHSFDFAICVKWHWPQ